MNIFLQLITNGVVVGSTYALVSLGFTLIVGVLGVVNMAHPELFMLAMFIGLGATSITHNIAFVLAAIVVGMIVAGLTIERLVLRPLKNKSMLVTLLGTLGAALVIQNVMAALVGSDPISFPTLVSDSRLEIGDVSISAAKLLNVAVMIVSAAAVTYYVRYTKWGRATRAVAENRSVAAAFGVNVNRVAQVTVVIAAVLAGIAGFSIANLYGNAWVFIGSTFTLKALVCMLVAGTRRIEGVVVVGLGLGILEALVTGYVSSNLTDAVAFTILIAVLFVRPSGIFGSYNTQ